MRVLITGAGGQVGSQLPGFLVGHEVTAATRSELDLADPEGIREAVEGLRPQLVVNCAAYNAVDRAETETEVAMRINAGAVRDLALACSAVGAHLVHISTDYVFPGTKGEPYDERDEPEPLSAYGRSKRAGELELMAHAGSWTLVRTAWVFGCLGRSFVEGVLRRLLSGEPLRVAGDQRGSPTCARDLAAVLARLGVERVQGLYHVTNAGGPSRYELACAIAEAAGLDPARVVETTSAEFPAVAVRPADSRLVSVNLPTTGIPPLRDYREALGELIPQLVARARAEVAERGDDRERGDNRERGEGEERGQR